MKRISIFLICLLATPLWAEPDKKTNKDPLSLDFLEFLGEFGDESGEVDLPESEEDDPQLSQPERRISPTEPLIIEPAIPVERNARVQRKVPS